MSEATSATTSAGSPRPPVSLVPPWLSNLASLSWRIAAIVGLIIAAWLLATLLWTVTASIAVAVVVSALFAPWVMRLRARGRSRNAAAAIVWASALVGLLAIGIAVLLAMLPSLSRAIGAIEAALTAVQGRIASLDLPPIVGEVVSDLISIVRLTVSPVGGSAAGDVVSWAASAVTILVLATFLVFFFLRDGDRAWLWAFQAVEPSKRDRITSAGEDALQRLAGYLRGTTILSAIIALTDLVFMLVLGVPSAVPLAILVFLGGYIPYFGGIVTTAIILVVTWATVGTFQVVVLLVLIAVRNAILGYGVRPTLYGRTVSIHPALVLLVLPVGFQLAGVIGLFAAVPVTAVVFAVAKATLEILKPDPPPTLPGLVPAWVDRVAQWSWRILVSLVLVAILVGVFVSIPLVLLPIVIALIIAATVSPLVQWLQGRGWSRARASAAAVGGGFLGIIALLILTALSLVSGAEQVANGAVAGASKVNDAIGGSLGGLVDAVAFGRGQIVQTVILAANEIAATAIVIVLSVLISFYLLRDGASLWHRLLGNARPAVRPELDAAGGRAFEVLGGYMSGTAVVSFVGAFSQLVIMVVLGIDFALPVFVLSFFLCFIPYIGGFISTGIALLLTVAVGSTTDIAVMIVWTLVFNIVTGNIVSPLVYGRTVHLHPAIVLVAIPAGAAIAGILGMFMVVPVLGIISATWRTVLAAMGAPSGDAGSAFQANDVEAEAAAADTIDTVDAPPLAADSAPA
jgi:predicted PurR-regulated permease PerM